MAKGAKRVTRLDLAKAERSEASPMSGTIALFAGSMRAEIRAEAGGRVAALWREDRKGVRVDVLAPMPKADFDSANWPKAGIYPLLPFSGRIRDARFPNAGRDMALEPLPFGSPHVLHGFAHRRPWAVAEDGDAFVVLTLDHDGTTGARDWPWSCRFWQRLVLDGSGLTHEIAVTNASAEPMPAGLGTHPFFAARPGDRVQMTLDAIWEQDADGFPTRLRPLAGRDRHIAFDVGSDTTTWFGAGFGGVASLRRADDARIVVETGAPLDQIVVHVPAVGGSCCLEPVSHAPDAFNLAARGVEGHGARWLAPGESLRAIVRIGLA